MKKLIIILFILPLSLFAQMDDKTKHKLAGNVICYGVSEGVFQATKKPYLSIFAGLGAGILAGVTKEVYDKSKGGQFNSFDLGATAFGSALSTMVFTVRLDLYYKKKNTVERIIKDFE